MFCKHCGKDVNDKAVICVSCGCGLNDPKEVGTFCKNCGKKINENAVICIGCGCSVEPQKSDMYNVLKSNNAIIWILAFAPIIGIIIEAIVSETMQIDIDNLWFITLILNISLGYADEIMLKKRGVDVSSIGALAFLIPVYMFKRAKLLNQNISYFVVWCVCFILILL